MFSAAVSLIVFAILHRAVASFALTGRTNSSASKSIAAAWYAGWRSTEGFPLSAVKWDKYDTLYYSFAALTSDIDLSLDGSNPPLLPEFVSEAHKHGVAAHIAVGGWTRSRWFSTSVATAENRTAFVKAATDFAEKYHVDGIQFDWEYPNRQGIGCNAISANDTDNFLSFLEELRKSPTGANLTLSAATPIKPFNGPTGEPSVNVSGFAEVLDYIAIMNYDVWGSWSPTVGPNAPLNDSCAPPADQQGSAVSAVRAWTNAGVPRHKIVLGLASYGHSYSVKRSDAFANDSKTELVEYPKFNASNQPLGSAWDNSTGGVDICGERATSSGGTFELWGLVDGKFLDKKGNPARGIHYRYDNCSQTPYVYNETSEVMVSFDDSRSFAAKGKFIKENELRGFALWEARGDYHDILIDSVRKAAGFE